MLGLIDLMAMEIKTHLGHYKNYITGDWENDLNVYKLSKKFDSDIVDLLLHALANSTSTSCYVVNADEDVKIEAIHPSRPFVVPVREIFVAKIGQHYDAIVDDKPRAFSLQNKLDGRNRAAFPQDPQHAPVNIAKCSYDFRPQQLMVNATYDKASGYKETDNRATDDKETGGKATHDEATDDKATEADDIGETAQTRSTLNVQSPTLDDSSGKGRNETTTNHLPIVQEKKQQRRMKKIKSLEWDGVSIKKTDAIPYDIDGNCIYQLPYLKNDRMVSSKDGRPWKKAVTSNRKEFSKGTRKIGKCKGGYECKSIDCMFRNEYGRNNTVNFDFISEDCMICRICKEPAIFRACPAVKVWEFQDDHVFVKHTGSHTCHPVPPLSRNNKEVEENVRKHPDLPPKRKQREAILDELYSGKRIEEVKSTARAMIDTRKISTIKRVQSQIIHPFGHSIDALKKLKLETEKTDKYYIFDIGDAALSSDTRAKTRFKNE